MSLPGQPNLPGSGWRPPRKRRRKRVFRASMAQVLTQEELGIGKALAIQVVAAQTGESARDVAAGWPGRIGERPSTYDHPLAIAARLGRRDYGAVVADLPDPTDPAQVRAFEVARGRCRAKRWGWNSEFWSRGAGRDNRSRRRHTR